ncbi:hypothetical protein Glove_290g113 [Diversispora epigaea]|uniref:Uncharacterized protein n=1 Tax=Diversispora epigaea TaxID=1348612 RepID=A0A397I6V7_9GLOM|nr:hypothetical protein Glove_290g113 [Diversispora epigaea]
MSTELYQTVYNFFTTSSIEHITAFSVIYQIMEDELLIQQDVLREIVNQAIDASTNIYSNDLIAQNKLFKIPIQSRGEPIPATQIQNPNAEIPNAEIPNPKSQIIISIFC